MIARLELMKSNHCISTQNTHSPIPNYKRLVRRGLATLIVAGAALALVSGCGGGGGGGGGGSSSNNETNTPVNSSAREQSSAICANSVVEGPETCDDGNTNNDDGCSSTCLIETGFTCPTPGSPCEPQPVCGNSIVEPPETCDDGNTADTDGCSSTCSIEEGFSCPTPGNACVVEAVQQPNCGNGLLNAPEICDDGNLADGDGCSQLCSVETGWDCPTAGEPCTAIDPVVSSRWTIEEAQEWHNTNGWLMGVNYTPAYAVNMLEMWQADTYDQAAIDRELGWAADLGMNTIRVFLHDVVWNQGSEAYLDRIDNFLAIADKHGIGTMLVLFDGVWDENPYGANVETVEYGELPADPTKAYEQLEPRLHITASRWVQSPGEAILGDHSRHDDLEGYVKGIIGHFKDDPRVIIWDLFNEPDGFGIHEYGLSPEDKNAGAEALLRKTFGWAREIDPTQPLTAGVWRNFPVAEGEPLSSINEYQLAASDIISFHSYSSANGVQTIIDGLKEYGRPILCTEYMARQVGSTFQAVAPVMRKNDVGAYSWGLVDGRNQTKYSWGSWTTQSPEDAVPWAHDILHNDEDGTPYNEEETTLLKLLVEVEAEDIVSVWSHEFSAGESDPIAGLGPGTGLQPGNMIASGSQGFSSGGSWYSSGGTLTKTISSLGLRHITVSSTASKHDSSTCTIDIRVGGGAWENLLTVAPFEPASGSVTLPESAESAENVEIRWHSAVNFCWINNVSINAIAVSE
ncbi:MAG TPA: DUF4215 domain-containing protein [Gammaproteobacteria bacterium]|nr:DUF4215 domain-containing protein [Gammaproteobacteria bacterium]